MSRPEGAADRVAPAGTADQAQRADSVAEHAEVGKQAALTRLGEMIEAAKKAKRIREGRPKKNGSDLEPFPERETLADLGIDKKVSVSTGLTQSSFGRVAQ